MSINLEHGTQVVDLENRLAVIEIRACDDPEPPPVRGTFHSFNDRHRNFVAQKDYDRLCKNRDVIELSYYEHGACAWYVRGMPDAIYPDLQWDGVERAGFWEPFPDTVKRAIKNLKTVFKDPSKGSQERLQELKKIAAEDCKYYSAWCNGWIDEAIVKVYDVVKDETGERILVPEFYENRTPVIEEWIDEIYPDDEEYTRKRIDDIVQSRDPEDQELDVS